MLDKNLSRAREPGSLAKSVSRACQPVMCESEFGFKFGFKNYLATQAVLRVSTLRLLTRAKLRHKH